MNSFKPFNMMFAHKKPIQRIFPRIKLRKYGLLKYNFKTRRLEAAKETVKPKVGMGITVYLWSDQHAGTITMVSRDKKTIWFKRDKVTKIGGLENGQQEYSYEPNPNAEEQKATRRKDSFFRTSKGNNVVRLDCRREYFDYSF